MYENMQLVVFLSSIGIHPDKAPSPNPGASIPIPSHNSFTSGAPSSGAMLVDTSLAFIKAYRL